MSRRPSYEKQLRWYPRSWRQRYGSEFQALMEDSFEGAPIPVRQRVSIAWQGTLERLHDVGLVGERVGSVERVQAGSLLVLCAWAVFIFAGSGFAKFVEHWDAVTPKAARPLPSGAYDVVLWSGVIGAVMIGLAVIVAMPAFVRMLSTGGWPRIRRVVLRAAALTSVTVLVSVAVIVWANHINVNISAHRADGTPWPYQMVGSIWVLLMTVTLVAWVTAAVAAMRRTRFSIKVIRFLGVLAVTTTGAMGAITVGTLVWWGAVASAAPWFFGNGVMGTPTSPVAAPLVAAGVLMILGLAAATMGTVRIARAWTGLRGA